MRPIIVVLRLARFSGRYFVANTCFAILVYFLLPIPLGLATYLFWRRNSSWRNSAPPPGPELASAATAGP